MDHMTKLLKPCKVILVESTIRMKIGAEIVSDLTVKRFINFTVFLKN